MVEFKYVCFEIKGECLHIRTFRLTLLELPPRRKQILKRDYPMKVPPPPGFLDLPVVHRLSNVYKTVYALGPQLTKRDRYGIYLKIEAACLEALLLATEAALTPRERKATILERLVVCVEMQKQLVRIAHEIDAIDQKNYIVLAADLVEASRMASGWLKYANGNPARGRD